MLSTAKPSAKDLSTPFGSSESFFDRVRAYVDFSPRDVVNLAEAGPVFSSQREEIVERFYAKVLDAPRTRRTVTEAGTSLARLKEALRSWLDELVSGPYDDAYFALRRRIGRRHVEVGLTVEHMFAATNVLRTELTSRIFLELAAAPDHAAAISVSLDKLLDLELAILFATYEETLISKWRARDREAVAERIAALEATAQGLAHEIGNPLSSLGLHVELLRRKLAHLEAEEAAAARSTLEDISSVAKRIEGLVRRFQEYSRGFDLSFRAIDLAAHVERFVAEQRPPAAARGVQISCDVATRPAAVLADPDRLSEVLERVATNAYEAMPAGGRLEVAVAARGLEAEVRLTDTGCGISPAERGKIFGIFYSTKPSGGGLGLAVSEWIVHAHGGRLAVDSRPGAGTTVRIALPMLAGHGEPSPDGGEPPRMLEEAGMSKSTAVPRGRILLADDESMIRESLAEVLGQEGYEVDTAADGTAALAAVDGNDYDVVITDLRMPGADGLAVLRRVRERAPRTLVLLVTAYASIETAVEALRQGAHDYILKPLIVEDVLGKLGRLFEMRQLAWETQMLRRELDSRYDFEQMIIGRSPAMRSILEVIRKVAPTPSTVLITGESGVGKEVVARAIHYYSRLHDKLFLPVNCGAIPENLLESQLFGHAKGAFTGALTANEGLFPKARGGTIFLDEIGDLPANLQVKLLRVIAQKEVLPVGANTPIRVDVRILAATNRDLRKAVEEGKFREDLYYRLNVVNIEIPPLRERREDVPQLVEYLVRRQNVELNKSFKGVDNATMKLLMSLPWKGNIRELENAIEHAMILGDGEWITPADLPRAVAQEGAALPAVGDNLKDAIRAYERGHIENVLGRTANDKRKAADLLGVSLSSLYRKIEELGIAGSD